MDDRDKIFENIGPRRVGLLRVVTFLIWCYIIAKTPLSIYASLPSESFRPWGVMYLLNALLPHGTARVLLSYETLFVLKVSLLVLCSLCVLGVRPFWMVGGSSVLLLILFDGVVKGFNGFINHGQTGVLYAASILALFPVADALSVQGPKVRSNIDRRQYSIPVFATALTLAVAYSFVGIERVLVGGVTIFTGDAIISYIIANTMQYSAYPFQVALALLDYSAFISFAKVGFAVVTLMEICSPLALLFRRFRIAWLVLMVPFHLSTLLLMNIFFWENLLLIIAVFINWNKLDRDFTVVR